MFGNLVNNRHLKELMAQNVIYIDPFNEKELSLVHYTLHVKKILKKIDNNYVTIHDFSDNPNTYELPPNAYIQVEILEKIKLLEENIVGQFIPCSNLIEQGLGLIAGKIDKKYGTTVNKKGNQEMIRFGVKNFFFDEKVIIEPYQRIAHVIFFDLHGVATEPVDLTDEDVKRRIKRMLYAIDDGPSHGTGK